MVLLNHSDELFSAPFKLATLTPWHLPPRGTTYGCFTLAAAQCAFSPVRFPCPYSNRPEPDWQSCTSWWPTYVMTWLHKERVADETERLYQRSDSTILFEINWVFYIKHRSNACRWCDHLVQTRTNSHTDFPRKTLNFSKNYRKFKLFLIKHDIR